MALASLIKISPVIIGSGTRLDVYASSIGDASVLGLNSVLWEPAVIGAPTLTMTLWDGDFTSAVQTGSASFSLKMNVIKKTYVADNCMWVGAPVEIYAEAPGTAWPWTLRFKGKVSSFSRRDQTLAITAEVDSEPFAANVLTATYAGTGGAEGSSNLKDRVKPLILGWASNVEPILIDETNSVYQFSGYGAIEAVSVLYERGSSFGASVGNFATYTALVAANIPAGRWGTCLAAGMVRLGAPAAGVITGDVRGHVISSTTPRLTGAVISALASIAGVSAGLINSASLTALNSAAPYPINLVLTDQVSFIDIATELARCCNWQAGVSLTGTYFVSKIDFTGSEVLTLDALGSRFPQVTRSDELDTSVPYYRTVLGAARSWRVHTGDEIAFNYTIEEKGLYSATVTYKGGQVVNLADQSRWIYINATPSSGNAPPVWPTTSNAYWENLTGPLIATTITYADGTTIEALKPAQIGSDKTSLNSAAAILGQGALATSALGDSDVNNAFASDANLVPNGGLQNLAVGWTFGTGQTAVKGATTNEPDYYVRSVTNGQQAFSPQVNSTERSFKARAGEKLFVTFLYRGQLANNAGCAGLLRIGWYDNNNTLIAFSDSTVTPTTANAWFVFNGSVTVPANAVKANVRFAPTVSAGWIDHGPVFIGRSESGADITANNTAAAITGQGALATSALGEDAVNNAFVSDANIVPNGGLQLSAMGWNLGSGQTAVKGTAATDPDYYVRSTVNGIQALSPNGATTERSFKVRAAEKLFVTFVYRGQLASNAGCVALVRIGWYDAANTLLSVSDATITPSTANAWFVFNGSLTVPANAVKANARIVPTVSAGWVDHGPIFLGRSEGGADITANNIASAIAGQGPLATSGLTAGEVTNAYVSDANICPNGGLQVSAVGWSLGAGMTATKGTVASEPDYFVRCTTDSAEATSPQVNTTERSFKVTPGEKLFLQYMVRSQVIGSATCRGRVRFVWYDTNNTASAGDEFFSAPSAAGTWQAFVNATTVPANAVKGQIRFRPNTGSGWVDIGPIFVARAEYGADITGNNTAAAFTGQGALATLSALFFGGSNLLETSGGAVATLANFKTLLGVASAVSGQGSLATSALGEGAVNNAFAVDANLCPNGSLQNLAVGWTLGSGATATKGTTTADPDYFVRCTTDLAESSSPQVNVTERSFKARPGEKMFLQFLARTQVIGSTTCRARVRFVWYDATNAAFAGDEVLALPTTANTWQTFAAVTTVPASAVKGQMRFRPNTTGGWVDVGPIFLARAEGGADITANNTAAAFTGQGALATLSALFFGGSNLTETSGGAVATLANFKTLLGIAASISGQGTLATKNNVNLSTSDAGVFGSIPLSVPSGGFTYSSTSTSVTISWAAMTIYRADLSTIAISSGSQGITGLTAGTTYRVYPYIVDSGGSSATVAFVTGASAGTPAIAHPGAGSALAAATMNQRGNIPLGRFNVVTPSSGSGGGSGGGFNCLHPAMEVDGLQAGELNVGDQIRTPEGIAGICEIRRTLCSEWFVLLSGAHEIARVTRGHIFYLATGAPIAAQDIRLGDLLSTAGDHIEVTGILLDRTPAHVVGISIPDPHLHFGGPANLLMHNGIDKP